MLAIANGAVLCWGAGDRGQLGDGSVGAWREVPVPVVGLASGAQAVTAGWYHACAVVNGGAACWGSNQFGQLGNGLQELDRIEIENRFRLRVIAERDMVAGKRQDVADAESSGPEEVALERQPVPVPAGQLENRFNPFPYQKGSSCQGGNPHVGPLVVRDIDGINKAAQSPGLFQELPAIASLGGTDLGSDGKTA